MTFYWHEHMHAVWIHLYLSNNDANTRAMKNNLVTRSFFSAVTEEQCRAEDGGLQAYSHLLWWNTTAALSVLLSERWSHTMNGLDL